MSRESQIRQILAQQLMQAGQQNTNPAAAGINSFMGAYLSGKGISDDRTERKQLSDALLGVQQSQPLPADFVGPGTRVQQPGGQDAAKQALINTMIGSSDPSMQKVGIGQMFPQSRGGATDYMVEKYRQDTGKTYADAWRDMYGGGVRGGYSIDESGEYVPTPGFADVKGGIKEAEEGGKQRAELNYKAPIVTAGKRAETDVAREAGYTKAQSALKGFEQQAGVVNANIDKALATISPWSTGYGSFLSVLPETEAGKLNGYLATIKANIGFDKLQNMRENSPTGGALGQVSDFENKLLQAVNGALDPKQSDQLKENLATIKALYPQVLEERKRAFNQDYGAYQPTANITRGAPTEEAALPEENIPTGDSMFQEGQTATNPNTGQKLTFRGGKWQ